MARRLGLPLRTWHSYEEGTAIPADVVLRIIELTSVEPGWLLYGTGPKYRLTRPEECDERRPRKQEVCALLREVWDFSKEGKRLSP